MWNIYTNNTNNNSNNNNTNNNNNNTVSNLCEMLNRTNQSQFEHSFWRIIENHPHQFARQVFEHIFRIHFGVFQKKWSFHFHCPFRTHHNKWKSTSRRQMLKKNEWKMQWIPSLFRITYSGAIELCRKGLSFQTNELLWKDSQQKMKWSWKSEKWSDTESSVN